MTAPRPGSRGDLQARTRADSRRFEGRKPPSFWRSLALIGSVGWPIALGSVGGALLGRLLDRHFHTGVRYTLILLTLLTAASTFAVMQTLEASLNMELAANVAWLLFGALAGILHAWLLWRGRGGPLARIGLVGAILVVAALARGLLPAATGWFAGLLVPGLLLCRREAR